MAQGLRANGCARRTLRPPSWSFRSSARIVQDKPIVGKYVELRRDRRTSVAIDKQLISALGSKSYDFIMCAARLSPLTSDRLLRWLPRLYSAITLDQLKAAVIEILDDLLESDGVGWFDYVIDDRGGIRLQSVLETVPCLTPAIIEKMPQTLGNHPFLNVWPRETIPSVLKLSDFPIAIRQRHLDEGLEVYREIGRENMTGPLMMSPRGVIAVSSRRDRKPFSERDRLVVTALMPHFRQAHANTLRFERLSQRPVAANGVDITEPLTPREKDVGTWVAEGKTNREIALILNLSPRTVEKHVESILRKLHVYNRTLAARELASKIR